MADYIERRKAAELICRLICGREREVCVSTYENCRQNRMLELYEIPAANVREDVQGEWKPTEYPIMSECEDCSVCGYRSVYGHNYKFCPNCGARMAGGDER